MGRNELFAFVTASAACWACTVSPPNFERKPCPCASGYSCDEDRNICVQGSLSAEAGASALSVSGLKPRWTTPHQIRWEWQVIGDAADFLRYELITANSQADVVSGTGSATIWTPETNPELGLFRLPHTGIGDPVTSTTTDAHPEFAEVYARLSVIDTQQRVGHSDVASGRTTVGPKVDVAIFVDALASGHYLVPPGAQLASTGGVGDSACIEFSMTCGATTCFEQPGIAGIDPDLSKMTPGDFDTTAHLAFAVRHDSAMASFWSQARVTVQHIDTTKAQYGLGGFTISSGSFRVYEIPLRELRRGILPDGAPLTHSEITQRLQEVTVGGAWGSGVAARLDEIHVRW